MKLCNDIAALDSIGKVFSFAEESATCLTIHRDGSFSAIFDDKPEDTRVCVDYRFGHSHANIRAMHGFNADKNEWQVFGREGRREYPTNRGRKLLVDSYKRLADALKGYHPNMLFLHRNPEGAWKA